MSGAWRARSVIHLKANRTDYGILVADLVTRRTVCVLSECLFFFFLMVSQEDSILCYVITSNHI